MNYLNIGILGCGMISSYHVKAIAETEGAGVIGAASHSYDSVLKLCAQFPYMTPFKSYDEMLGCPEIDTIVICTPSGNHYEEAKAAILSGKNVIIEKPMCTLLEDARDLIDTAKRQNVFIVVISQSRFSDAAQLMKETVSNGDMGRLVSAQLMMRYYRGMKYYDSAAWRGTLKYDGGGVLMNQGIHGIDLLCYIMGKPASVMGYSKTLLRDIEVEDTAAAALEFENGALATIDATVCSSPSFSKKFIFAGEKGTVIMEEDAIVFWSLDKPCPLPVGMKSDSSASADPSGITHTLHAKEYANIVSHVRDGVPLIIDGEEGYIPLSVILGVYESSRTGRRIQL
jgi:UDP-N-acetyl-2-amino-2-deoxyglucuronate dehydrogenase